MVSCKDILIETQYLAPVAFFAFLSDGQILHLEAHEHYQKGSYRNRCHILGANGLLRLSIPLKGGRNHAIPVKEIEISYAEPWHKRHLHSIRSAYGTAPYFDHYYEGFSNILRTGYNFLFELNLKLMEHCLHLLNLDVQIYKTTEYQSNPDQILDLRNCLSPKAKHPEKNAFPSYYQVFREKTHFIPNLSIVDLLFNIGPEASLYIKTLGAK